MTAVLTLAAMLIVTATVMVIEADGAADVDGIAGGVTLYIVSRALTAWTHR
jgi:hypothetical protein